VLTLPDYIGTGGIMEAVATAARRAHKTLTEDQQDTARLVFLRLTATSADGTDTAIPATRAELEAGKDPASVRAVLDAFARERLLTLTRDGAEISHEVLLTAWSRGRRGARTGTDSGVRRLRLHFTPAPDGRRTPPASPWIGRAWPCGGPGHLQGVPAEEP
jgi:hypothetical protein